MSLVPKNKIDWQPSATIETLQQRAIILQNIRAFFTARGLWEVQTPVLSQHTVTDPHIESFSCDYQAGKITQRYFLQTSPEYAMKRLLAAGSGAIFQITPAFRNGECGHQHNPEFTMLEWYRPGFDHHQLMDEVDLFLQTILHTAPAEKTSYHALFQQHVALNPHTCNTSELITFLQNVNIVENPNELDRDTALQLIMSHHIEPHIGQTAPLLVYDFPASQAALAKIRYDQFPVAERFEAYYQGKELANGFHELTDTNEQSNRFTNDNLLRKKNHLPAHNPDHRFLAALATPLPECAGVAIGIDRLIMLALQKKKIGDVISFDWHSA